MAADLGQTPFVKQLGSSDRPTREAALNSLRTYLLSSRQFTDLELLKLWKGLFFCMWHSDRPIPQQRLALSLSQLLLPLPESLFLPFLNAFWTTIAREWTSIDALRLDKFLRLIRFYVNAAFSYLAQRSWNAQLLKAYLELVERIPFSVVNGAVSDGLRYHVLDVWVDELDGIDEMRDAPAAVIMSPVERLGKEGKARKVRERALECLEDARLADWSGSSGKGTGNDDGADADEDEEWEGLGD